MLFFPYLLASLLAYAGLLIGFLLVTISPEERLPLRKPVLIAQQAIILFALSTLALFMVLEKTAIFLLLLGAIMGISIIILWRSRPLLAQKKAPLCSACLGLGTAILSANPSFLLYFLCASALFFATQAILTLPGKSPSLFAVLRSHSGYLIAAVAGYWALAIFVRV